MKVDCDTQLVFFLGNPLRQSASTAILNHAYEYYGLNYLRIPVEVPANGLKDLLKGMRQMHLAGFNVTKPYKIAVVPELDELDPLAARIGAVNCVVCTDGCWKGYNTDAEGFLEALCAHLSQPVSVYRYFCIGAGGAGRAACFALAGAGSRHLVIMDQNPVAAETLCRDLNRCFPGSARMLPYVAAAGGNAAAAGVNDAKMMSLAAAGAVTADENAADHIAADATDDVAVPAAAGLPAAGTTAMDRAAAAEPVIGNGSEEGSRRLDPQSADLAKVMAESQVVMNFSGIGMAPHLGESPVPGALFHAGQFVFDAIYNPEKSRFLCEAEAAGCTILNGKEMLINCNIAGFEKICGFRPPMSEWLTIMNEV